MTLARPNGTGPSEAGEAPGPGHRADRIIAGKYRFIRLLGKGGMGSVWLAEHMTLKTEVAIKLIDSELGKLAQARARFVREAQLAARVKSSHVVQIFDHGVDEDGQAYIVMEYLIGESLRDRLDRGPLTLADTARVVSHVCRALTRAHEAGLIHRDLKPDNVFIAREGEEERMMVLDFGVAKAADALSDPTIDPTRTGAMLGTPFYISPEQAQGLKTIDHRTDLWSAGILIFECLTATRQFSADALGPLIAKIMAAPIVLPSAAAPNAGIPKEVDTFLLRALERDPAARFGSAKELAEAFLIASGMSASVDSDLRGSSLPPLAGSSSQPPQDAGAMEFAATVLAEPEPRESSLVNTRPSRVPAAPVVTQTPSRLPWVLVGVMTVVIAVLATLLIGRR